MEGGIRDVKISLFHTGKVVGMSSPHAKPAIVLINWRMPNPSAIQWHI
jgi:hypothetical protein